MEVTQGIQHGFNSVEPLGGRAPWVRVYAREASGSAGAPVTAQLHGFRAGGGPLPGSPLSPAVNPLLDLEPNLPLRGEADETFTFLLPEFWTRVGRIELQAEVNPNQQAFELDYCHNLYPVIAVTESGLWTEYPPPSDGPAEAAAYYMQMERAQSVLSPIVEVHPSDISLGILPADGSPSEAFDLSTDDGRGALVSILKATANLSDPPSGCDAENTVYAGLVHEAAHTRDESGSYYGGEGSPDGILWAKMFLEAEFQESVATLQVEVGLPTVYLPITYRP